MSQYDSDTEIYEDEQEKYKQLFRYDTSLLRSVEDINEWKQNLGCGIIQYLKRQEYIVAKEYELLTCGKLIRALAFCSTVEKGFSELIEKYSKAYAKVQQSNFDITAQISKLDQQLEILVRYLMLLEANNVLNMYAELQEDSIRNIYANLRKAVDFCLDLNILWITMLAPRMFREEQKENLYKVNYGGTLLYYEKQLSYLLDRIKKAQIKNFTIAPGSQLELIQKVAKIINNQKLKPNLKTKIISLLKGQNYISKENKTLKEQFILLSFQMYHGEEVSQLWDYEGYEDICLQTLRKSFSNPQYIDCTLYMEPQNIDFERRKKTIQFAQTYYDLIDKIVNLRHEKEMSEKKIQSSIDIPLEFIQNILNYYNVQLLGHLYVNFLISSKNAFSFNSPELDKLLFGILENLRQIYLSFGTNHWITHTSMLSALNHKFFSKFSEDIKPQIISKLPMMVQYLGEDKLPTNVIILTKEVDGKKQYVVQLQQVSRSEHLLSIFCYIRDAEYKDRDFYLDLPQVTPSSFQTAIMFIKSLQLKLRHHEPTDDQKKLWTMIIEQSEKYYKVKVNFKWFKPQRRLDVEEREGEFLIQKQIHVKWAYDLVQKALNFRDQEKYQELANTAVLGDIEIQGDLIAYFKYAVNVKINAARWTTWIREHVIFRLLDKMRTLLEINYGDIVHLAPDQLVTLNQLHLCLMLYNTQIQYAKGNQNYSLIIHKIVIPWMESNDKKACERFQQQFPSFFSKFILRDYYLIIGDSIINILGSPKSPKQNLIMKIQFFANQLSQQSVMTTPIDCNVEFLQRVYSVLSEEIDMDVLISLFLLVFRFIEYQHQLEDQYISLGFLINLIVQSQKFTLFLTKIQQLDVYQKNKINNEIVKKLPQIFHIFSVTQLNKILESYIDSEFDNSNSDELLKILDEIPEQRNTLILCILRAFVAERNLQRKKFAWKSNAERNPQVEKQIEQKILGYWKKLEQYVDANCIQKKPNEEQVDLTKVTEVFEETVLRKLKEDYRNLLLDTKKKSSLKKKSLKKINEKEIKEKEQDIIKQQLEDGNKLLQAKIWRKVVKNFGTFQDIIHFGQDPIELVGAKDQEIYNDCLKIIQQKRIQQKYLKRIIRKLPILQKCAQDTVKQIQQKSVKGEQIIQPQLICKLIMINSRYKSDIVQNFILSNLSTISIPIKIYQEYLVDAIKKKLQSLPKDTINKMIYEDLGTQNMRKINEIFELLVYLPIKKFEHIYLRFQEKIQQKQQGENEEWQTQSEGEDQDQEQQQQTSTKQIKDKKKQSETHIQKKQQQVKNEDFEDNESDYIDDNGQQQQYSHEEDESIMDEDQQEKPKIVDMFYEDNPNLVLYKETIKIREQLNIAFEDNYQALEHLQQAVKKDGELEKKLFRLVDALENEIKENQITLEILNKMPANLFQLLKIHGLTRDRNAEKIEKYRKQVIKMPRFIKDYMSDRDENSVHESEQDGYEDQIYEEADELSEQTASIDDIMGDNEFFIVGEDGQLAQINTQQLFKNQQMDSQQQQEEIEGKEDKIQSMEEANDVLSLPQLKQINSKIEFELTGKQLAQQEMVKILQIAIIKLFSLHIYQLKHKPILSFYKDLINSKQGKIFIDTLLTVLRVDESYQDVQRFQLAKKLNILELAIPKALQNLLEIAYDISTQDSKEGTEFNNTVRDQVRQLLPIGDQIMIKSNIPVQDNYLTLLIFYSRYNQKGIHEKIKKLLSSLNLQENKPYELSKGKAALLTKNIYKNSNSSSIWNSIEENFGVKIEMKTKFSSCLTIYGRLLRQDVQKCYNDLLDIIKVPLNSQQTKQEKENLLKQHEKKVQQSLRKHFKRIKHYYYWNKRNIISEIDKLDRKPHSLLKDRELIKLTQLMIFYCHFIKQKFFEKIDEKAMKNLLLLPKSIIETSFMFLWKLEARIDKWEPLAKVKQYFKSYKLYEHKFNRLEEVCNLILQFLEMPQFSNPKFKQVIIPYFISKPQIAQEIPLIFKLPDIPEELNGQKLFLTRECSFDMAFYQLVENSFLIEFHNQEGSDHGGMVRQLMMGWTGVGIGEQHIFIGKILAFSFKKSIPYGGKFDVAMAVAITQYKVTIQFLEQVQPEVAQSLKYVRDNDPEDLDVKFQITKQELGIIKHYPLIPNGQDVAVTNENKQQYIQLFLANYFLVGREWQMSELCTGFFSSVNKKYASIFHPLEMIQKIQGQQISDYMKLKDKAKYQQGYTESSQMIKWFWEIVSQFNQKQMNRFLQFITGAPKVSIYNHSFQFVIEKPYGEDESRLPVAHTCFTTLELPQYKTKQILKKKLTQAIFEGNDNFGIM